MPVYLRFVKGVIDSADLPLNVSRELLQESRDVKAIREGSTKRVLSMLEALADSEDAADKEKYAGFWKEFGAVLKEGIGEDHANSERLAKLLRFASTHADEGVSFADYVSRMKEGQEAIYYITADNLARSWRSSARRASKCCCWSIGWTSGCSATSTSSMARACKAWPRAPSTWASCRTRQKRSRRRKPPPNSSRCSSG
jgi:hypothetical protein